MSSLDITKRILASEDIHAKKKFGQNFLIDDEVLQNIVLSSNVGKDNIVLEIGPGIGNLTEYILKTGATVYAFEIDTDMIKILEKRFYKQIEQGKLIIYSQDILKVDLNNIINTCNEKVKVIANLPYYITTPIIFKLLENKENISEITIMVQRELADRLMAKEGGKDYGILTITVGMYANVLKVQDVQKTSFVPSPSVVSTVVKMVIDNTKIDKYNIKDTVIFKSLVKASFSTRRKTLVNSITNAHYFNITKEQLEDMLVDLGINKLARAEEITIESYAKLSNIIANCI